MGLNDDRFSSVRSQLLALESLPSLDKIFNIIMQEENHRMVMTQCDNATQNGAAFAVTISRSLSQRPTCNHCGKVGHDEQQCYEIIGYSVGWVHQSGRRGRGRCRGTRGGCDSSSQGRGQIGAYAAHTTAESRTPVGQECIEAEKTG